MSSNPDLAKPTREALPPHGPFRATMFSKVLAFLSIGCGLSLAAVTPGPPG